MTQSIAKNAEIGNILLTNFEGKQLDITNLTLEFGIYEDMFSQFLSGYIILDDTNGILERMPIIGEEFIEIPFKTAGERKYLKYNFATYKIENVASSSDNAQPKSTFIIHLVAPELIVSNTISVDNSYVGFPCSYIIEKIHEDYFNKSDKKYSSEKKIFLKQTSLDVENTDGNVSIVSPLSTPFDLIRYCVKHSRSLKYPESDFIYYQDADGYHLKTVSALMDQDIVEDYYLGEATEAGGFGDKEIQDYQFVAQVNRIQNFDVLSRQNSGMYDNTIGVIDPLLKRYQDININYLNKDVSFTGLNNRSKLNTDDSIHAKADGSSHARYIVANISGEQYSEVSYLKKKVVKKNAVTDNTAAYPSSRYKYLNSRISKMSQLQEGIKLHLALPGNSNLRVGQNINFHMPQTSSDNEYKENILFGEKQNAKFIITSLNHVFTVSNKTFFTNVEIIKNGFGSKIKRRE